MYIIYIMNIKNYLDDNKIEQIYVSEALNDNRNTFLKNIIINEYSDTTKNTLFWGMYERSDIIKIKCHKGKKWIFWGGNDANIKIPQRLQIVKLMKKLDIEEHILLDKLVEKNLSYVDIIANNINMKNDIENIDNNTNHAFDIKSIKQLYVSNSLKHLEDRILKK